jgi:hypothetical protein
MRIHRIPHTERWKRGWGEGKIEGEEGRERVTMSGEREKGNGEGVKEKE